MDGLRCTDAETMDVVQQVLCGKVNKNLAATLNRRGGRAIGLCGLDAGLFQARLLLSLIHISWRTRIST